MAYDLEKENKEILARYKDLISNTYRTLDEDQNKLIRKAFDIALDAHKDQRRKTGEPYIYHPIEVAKIVANEIGLGATSIACALLHDVIEDSEYTYEDLEKIFGKKIADIVNGLTKISVMNNQNISIQSENYRKLLLTLSEDFRVILIKIADRLHNMRTLESMRPDKQQKIASETVYIYAPMAHRLGLYTIKSELEDLSLKYNNPEIYNEITSKLASAKESRDKYIQEFKKEVSEQLEEEGLNFTIKGRAKAISSIYRKMLKQNVTFEEVFDNYAIRIIYKSDTKNEKFLAWKIYSIVTDLYRSNPSRMRDWISHPRSTGYESLHLTVMGPDKKWIEVQIRSERMDEIAEKGVAAHYRYKEGYKSSDDQNFDRWVTEIREVLEQQQDLSTSELLDNIKLNLYSKEVFVFTPKGEIKILPTGATALDFAFSVHSDLGMRCLGAKVNGKLVPISYVLQNGDQVDILSSQNQKPKADWLDFVVTSKAKSRIKAILNSEKNNRTAEGKEILQRKMRHAKLNFNDEEINKLQKFLNLKTSQDVFLGFQDGTYDMGDLKRYLEGRTLFGNLLQRFRKAPTTKLISANETATQDLDLIVFGKDEEKLNYSFAKCCTVIPGDKIFGFITISEGIKVHNDNCPNAINLRANFDYRVLVAKWVNAESFKNRIQIEIEGLDRMGMINDITAVISNSMGMDMKSMSIASDDGIFTGTINLEVKNKKQLEDTFKKLKNINGVSKVKRL
ncbi:RelA/SpoT family protein [Soonwooa sp.]|uniref:RelA/SpoT family protein n=1 Tax=Soonwooa sp. TaxID=1938592 RepID=UPI00260DDB6C|nr:RelA/SpoT family protein [Soonwooa sp.]